MAGPLSAVVGAGPGTMAGIGSAAPREPLDPLWPELVNRSVVQGLAGRPAAVARYDGVADASRFWSSCRIGAVAFEPGTARCIIRCPGQTCMYVARAFVIVLLRVRVRFPTSI